MVEWLAVRIQEIDSFLPDLPTIAILVNSEEEVQSVADALNTALTDLSTSASSPPSTS